ncbi:exocyst complex component 2-like [Varroa jacobsoni]|uniref:Exocyst complex component 2 n=1 Tax=Varroa destructor TaxID=109461 RepID=A0A7M7L444_VARDE|nr:exocyst complex component 2-like [Varroa destructor]XP_022703026.1 exocyst complex component 2-like [Varroa jacobsoni]
MDDYTPKVTGLSPAEGSPGTKVTIRGENFGTGQNDLVSVTICGMDCTMFSEWKSSHKIVTRTRICSGVGDVIITTKSGGKGSCTVQFKGIHESVSPTVESAVWVDEAHHFHGPFFPSMKGPTSSSSLAKELNLLGGADQTALSPTKESDLKAQFGDKTTDVFSRNFSPDLYLLTNHMQCSFENLRTGLKELERRVSNQQEGPTTFLKSNVYAIVKCLDVLKELNKVMNKDRTEMGSALTENVAQHLKETLYEASSIFEQILRRKESSDSMRTSLSILHKFRFLFNLPAQIEHNVKAGEYDTVISDYARARSVFHDTEVGIFKRVLNDVESKVALFKEKLYEGIRKFPGPLDQRKKLISYLVQLEPERNPGWEAIKLNQKWLLKSMDDLKNLHLSRACSRASMTDTEGESDPPQVEFVLSLCRFFCSNAPDFFKLQQAYLQRDMEGIQTAPSEEEERRSSDLTLQLESRLCLEVRSALLPTPAMSPVVAWPHSPSQSIGPWLPTCLRHVRKCYSSVLKLDPPHAAARMQSLITDLREHAIISLLSQAAQDISHLHEYETWQSSSSFDVPSAPVGCGGRIMVGGGGGNQFQGAHFGASQLPLLFENRVIEALQVIQENVLQSSAGQMFKQMNVKVAIMQNVEAMIKSYVNALEKAPSTEKTQTILREVLDRGCGNSPGGRLSIEDKLLITLANVAVSREHVLRRIKDAFDNQQYPDITDIINEGDRLLAQVDQRVLQLVISRLQRPLVDMVEELMQEYSVEWNTPKIPNDVSTYVKELLLELTEVQQQILRICPTLIERVLPPIAAALVAEVARQCQHVKATSVQGNNLQICVDILALESALRSLDKNNLFEVLRPCKDRLGATDRTHKELVDDVVRQFKFNQRLQIMCFQ